MHCSAVKNNDKMNRMMIKRNGVKCNILRILEGFKTIIKIRPLGIYR